MIKYLQFISIFYLITILAVSANELKINSNKLDVDRNSKISIFSGNVYAFNEDIKMWSEKLIIKFNIEGNKIKAIDAENKVKIISQGITATGDKGIYHPDKDIINIYGNVEVSENDNYVTCDELFLDIKNSISIMKSTSSNRVEAFIVND